jgi:ATP-dependent RNA helicase DeaD
VRLFINVGTKDGITTNERLLQFITESTDIEPGLIERITVREMSSFFNVSSSAAEYITQVLSQKKHKGRKVRVEEAEQRDRERNAYGPKGNSERGNYSTKPSYSKRSGDSKSQGGYFGSQKFNGRNKKND